MTESAAILLNHPLGYAALAVIAIAVLAFVVAAINLALTAKLLNTHRAAGVSAAGAATKASAHMPATDERAIVAAIAAAVTATLGARRIIYIGAQQSGAGWAAELRLRHHTSHMPQQPYRH
jgi:hypothetical protein